MKIKEKILRKMPYILSGAAALALVAGVAAYFARTQSADNHLVLKGSGVVLGELFHQKDKWLPGETKEKKVFFSNQEKADQIIRFRIDEKWYNAGNQEWKWEDIGITASPATLNYTSAVTGSDPLWQKVGEWYYYRRALQSDEETVPVLSSVTFGENIANGGTSLDDFSDKTCRLTVVLEALPVSSDASSTEWRAKFTKNTSTGVLSWQSAD